MRRLFLFLVLSGVGITSAQETKSRYARGEEHLGVTFRRQARRTIPCMLNELVT